MMGAVWTRRPSLELLEPARAEALVVRAEDILGRTGVWVGNDEALALLDGAGARIEGRRARMGAGLIHRCLNTAPRRIKVYGRDGTLAMDLGGKRVHFNPGSAAIRILDPHCLESRTPVTADLVDLARVTEALGAMDAQSTALVPGDVPEALADQYRLYVALRHCRKPVVTGTFAVESFGPMREMLEVIRGGAEALAAKPLAIFDCCPSPPLRWSDLTCQALIDCARRGIPAELVSMPLSGATAPVSLEGCVLQHTAECLSGVVIHQLARPGSPIIWGGSPSGFDMRFGTTPMGAIETMMIDVSYSQVGHSLGLPTHAYMVLSDAKLPDYQAGLESGLSVILAVEAGINNVSGPGMLAFESCQSLEKLILDAEACEMGRRFGRGVARLDEDMGQSVLAECYEEATFLEHPHTLKHFRSELHRPGPTMDRQDTAAWVASGKKSAFDRAEEQVRAILKRGPVAPPLEPEQEDELRRIMLAQARGMGMEGLPL